MNDRFKFSQFYQQKGTEVQYTSFQKPEEEIYTVEKLNIVTCGIDLTPAKSQKARLEVEQQWIEVLPKLIKLKALSVKHRVKQDFFESICRIPNLERLEFCGSLVEDISSISKLKELHYLKLWSFTRLNDISPLLTLKKLKVLSIDNCFKVGNYEVIGQMTQLVGLELCGDTFAPKYLKLKSLRPFENLKNLKHLDFSRVSLIDKSYESILKMENLERFDLVVAVPEQIREKIKAEHKKLKAGFFVDYDFENNKFYEGKQWQFS